MPGVQYTPTPGTGDIFKCKAQPPQSGLYTGKKYKVTICSLQLEGPIMQKKKKKSFFTETEIAAKNLTLISPFHF